MPILVTSSGHWRLVEGNKMDVLNWLAQRQENLGTFSLGGLSPGVDWVYLLAFVREV